jgi:hypothetical protein
VRTLAQRDRGRDGAFVRLSDPIRADRFSNPGVETERPGGKLPHVLKLIVLLAIIGIVLVAWLALRGYGDGGPRT